MIISNISQKEIPTHPTKTGIVWYQDHGATIHRQCVLFSEYHFNEKILELLMYRSERD